MPVFDTTSILGGYNVPITDWVLGDDRQFSGDIVVAKFPPPPGDLNLSDAFFTLKLAPTDTDQDALIQKHITQVASAAGVISLDGSGSLAQLLIKIASGDYEGITSVVVGPLYYWDVRCITSAGGVTFTTSTGTIRFVQNVTQANKSGVPAVFPNSGNPRFRGFSPANPQSIASNNAISNVGDFYMNALPTLNAGPAGWQCIGQGAPGVWQAFGVGIGSSGVIPPFPWTFGTAAPIVGTHAQGEIVWNIAPIAGGNIGWVCVIAGTPGTWKAFGPIELV